MCILWGGNCSFMYNLNTRQSSKVYLSKLLEVKSFLCFSVFLAFAQCIGILEVRGFQVIVLFQLKLRKWKWIPSTYEWTLHPYIRHFVRWAVSPFLHPPTHPQTYPPKWYALHRSLSIATSRRLWWTGHVVRLGCHRHADTKLICEIISETDSWNTKKKNQVGKKRNSFMKTSWEWELDQTGSGRCPMAGSVVSGLQTWRLLPESKSPTAAKQT